MSLEAWQISLFVTAAVVLGVAIEAAVSRLLRHNLTVEAGKRVRTGALALLGVLAVVVFVIALGTSLADKLASVAAAAVAIVTLWLTWHSYQAKTPDPPLPPAPPPVVEVDDSPPAGRHHKVDS